MKVIRSLNGIVTLDSYLDKQLQPPNAQSAQGFPRFDVPARQW
jgi:hypothetical protein